MSALLCATLLLVSMLRRAVSSAWPATCSMEADSSSTALLIWLTLSLPAAMRLNSSAMRCCMCMVSSACARAVICSSSSITLRCTCM
ncbi:hypothetical protein D3C72_1468420 [compost metagenome]